VGDGFQVLVARFPGGGSNQRLFEAEGQIIDGVLCLELTFRHVFEKLSVIGKSLDIYTFQRADNSLSVIDQKMLDVIKLASSLQDQMCCDEPDSQEGQIRYSDSILW